jgi:hypothetical protein
MSAKRKTDEETITPVEPADQPAAIAAKVPLSDYVRIVNLTPHPTDFMLTNGRSIACGPKLPGKNLHKSKPVLRQFLHPHTRELETLGIVALEAVQEGEV